MSSFITANLDQHATEPSLLAA